MMLGWAAPALTGEHGLYQAIALWSEIVSSVLFAIALVYLFVRFVQPAIQRQAEAKNAEIADNERRRDRALEQARAAEVELSEASESAVAIVARGTRDALRERERIIAEARAEGERVVRNAQSELERSRYAARLRLRDELLERALEIARREAPSKIDERLDTRLVGSVMDAIDPSSEVSRA